MVFCRIPILLANYVEHAASLFKMALSLSQHQIKKFSGRTIPQSYHRTRLMSIENNLWMLFPFGGSQQRYCQLAQVVQSPNNHNFCRGGFSHINTVSLGAAIPAKQHDTHWLEAPRPAHSGKRIAFTDQICRARRRSRYVGAGLFISPMPLVTQIAVLFPQNIRFTQGTRPIFAIFTLSSLYVIIMQDLLISV